MAYTVRTYGIRRILSGEEHLNHQLRARVRYWNTLVEVERAYRQRIEDVLAEFAPGLQAASDVRKAAELACDEAVRAEKSFRQAGRTRKVPDDLRQAVQAKRTMRREAREYYNTLRREMFARDDVRAALDAAEQARRQAIREARADTDLYWGTYLQVEASYKVARQGSGGHRLRFHHYDGSGTIGVRLHPPIASSGLWDGSSRMLQIEPVPVEAWHSPVRGERRRLCRTTGRIRVGTDDGTPLWVEFGVAVDCPIPDGYVRQATITRRRVASQLVDTLSITVEVPEPSPVSAGPPIGVDVGWRLLRNGDLRVAYAADQDGPVMVTPGGPELALPARLVSGFRKADELLAIRDQRFNVELAWLRGWLNERHAMIPEWLRDATAVLPHWRSKARLAALTVRWGRQRFPGDDEAYQRLKEWRSWDKHLWEWEAHQRRKAALRRRDLYRVWAARLTDLGRPLALEEFDLRSMVRAHEERAVRRNRLAAAVGELRSALRTAATRKGTPVVTVPGRGTTQTCHCCEKWVEFDAKYELIAACPHCGEEWDQDYNAARNLARLGEQCEALAATS